MLFGTYVSFEYLLIFFYSEIHNLRIMSLTDQVTVKIRTIDGAVFELNMETANMLDSLKVLLANMEPETIRTEIISLNRVTERIMKKIIEWCKFHQNDQNHCSGDANDLSEWDRRFLKVDSETLFSLALAADYLGMEMLYRLSLGQIVSAIKSKRKSQIRSESRRKAENEDYELLIDNIDNYPI